MSEHHIDPTFPLVADCTCGANLTAHRDVHAGTCPRWTPGPISLARWTSGDPVPLPTCPTCGAEAGLEAERVRLQGERAQLEDRNTKLSDQVSQLAHMVAHWKMEADLERDLKNKARSERDEALAKLRTSVRPPPLTREQAADLAWACREKATGECIPRSSPLRASGEPEMILWVVDALIEASK